MGRGQVYKVMNMRHIITEEYIKSDVYKHIMEKYMTDDCNPFLQEENTENWNYRSAQLKALGAWKWFSTYRHKDLISTFVFSDKKGIDFGGYNGPIWGNSEVVDIYPEFMHRKIQHIPDKSLQYIFTSHCLEHIASLDWTLKELYRVLQYFGAFIIIVPSWNCERWQANKGSSGHVWTFTLNDDEFTRIDKKIEEAGFKILQAEYTWDNGIFILAAKGED